MTLKEIRDLIELMRQTGVSELEVERGGTRVRIRCDRGASQAAEVPATPPQAPAQAPPPAPAAAPPPPAAAPVEEPQASNLVTVTSPMVGTFYRAPAPDAKPYVEEGDTVTQGQVLCLIEAMKLMNEIESEVDGRIVKILAENAQPVEYGAPLFLIEPL